MQRRLWVRSLIALWSLWFTAAVTEPAGLLVCAMHPGTSGAHGAGHGGHAMSAMSSPQHASRGGSSSSSGSGHVSQAVAHSDAAAGAPAPKHTGGCSCLGECCAVTPPSLPVRSVEFALGIRTETTAVPESPSVEPTTRQPYLLPFANGPPRAV